MGSSDINVSANSYINTQRPICKDLRITNLTKNLSCNSSNPQNCNVSKGDKLKFRIDSQNGNYFYFLVLKEYANSKIFFENSTTFNESNEYETIVDNNSGLIRYEVRGYVRYLDGTEKSNMNNNSNYNKCVVSLNLPEKVGNSLNDSTPSCENIGIKILTKNNYQCRMNSGDCPVQKNDEIELTVQSSKQNSNIIGYMLYKDYSDGTSVMVEQYNSGINSSKYSYNIKVDNDPQLTNIRIIGMVGYPVSIHHANFVSNSFSCVANFNYPLGQNNNSNNNPNITTTVPSPTNISQNPTRPTITSTPSITNTPITNTPISDIPNGSNQDNDSNTTTDKSLLFTIKQITNPTKSHSTENKYFYDVNLEIKNVGKNEINIKDIDLKAKYDSYLISLNKINIKKGSETFEVTDTNKLKNFVLSNLGNLSLSSNLSTLNVNEYYQLTYTFEVSYKPNNDQYCVDFVSEKFNEDLKECVSIQNQEKNDNYFNLWILLGLLIILLIILTVIWYWYIKRKKDNKNEEEVINKS